MWNEEMVSKCRKAAAEGVVLLENNDNILPLDTKKTVAVFGRTQIDYYRSGTGSGGAVRNPYTVNLIEGLKNQGASIHEELLGTYEDWIKENPFDNGSGGWASEPWYQKEMFVSDDLAKRIGETAKTAIVVMGRTAGEDKDNKAEKGSYYLIDEELQLLKTVCRHFSKVVVVLNVSNIIDMSWLLDDEIKPTTKAVLYSWHGGMEGGNGVAEVLCGAVTPSGKLPDTIAYKIENYPSTEGFEDEGAIRYKDDIYVGYRYFETFNPEYVQYGFGYGLSYTQFSITPTSVSVDGNTARITVNITNTGTTYTGKEVVQLYYEAPQGKLGKAKRSLGCFAKTKELKPGESQSIIMEMAISDMASYDDSGVTGHPHCYVLEEGTYHIYIGNSVRSAMLLAIDGNDEFIVVDKTKVVAEMEAIMSPVEPFERLKTAGLKQDGTYEIQYEKVSVNELPLRDRINSRLPDEIKQTGDKGYLLQDVASQKVSLEDFTAQLTDEELATIVRGEGMSSLEVTAGTAAAFGGLSPSLCKYGIPVACAADGPSGIRMDADASLVPIGTLLSATWNLELVAELYEIMGEELQKNNVDLLLGPGMNIHRNPLNGRNFEYYSEDPLITGKFAAAMTKGLAKHGAIATLKHFACNNREHDRNNVNAIVSERALREIYLRSFEIAVKEGGARSIMTSYNPINGHYASSNYDLNTTVLRGEWGYKGIVMTDWWANVCNVYEGGEPNKIYLSNMLKAQNDLYMVVENYGSATNINEDNILSSLESGELNRGELQRSVMNILRLLITTFAYKENNLYKDLSPNIQPLSVVPAESEESVCELDDNRAVCISNQTPVYVRINSAGAYNIKLIYRLRKSSLAQGRGFFILNDDNSSMFLLNGTDGAEKEKFLYKADLSCGVYKMLLVGFEDSIEFVALRFEQ